MDNKDTKYTPGPWSAGSTCTRDGHHEVFGSDDCLVASVPSVVTEYEGNVRRPARANAKLIAAAPDLLAALKAMVKVDAEDGADDEYLHDARAAIAKAEGR